MKFKIALIVIMMLSLGWAGQSNGQSKSEEEAKANAQELSRLVLTNSLKELESEAIKLDQPLARATAYSQIADVAWALDQDWAQSLLKRANELTYPSYEEREQGRKSLSENGDDGSSESKLERDRVRVRRRILLIAARNAKFAAELAEAIGKDLGKTRESGVNVAYANNLTKAGDVTAAGNFILSAIEADPTQVWNGYAIYALADKNRPAADALILRYLELLKDFPLTSSNFPSVLNSLDVAVFADNVFDPENRKVKPAAFEIIRAYLNFALSRMAALEQDQPGSLHLMRASLPRLWQRINVYAPELRSPFLALSRLAGLENLPDVATAEGQRSHEDDLLKKADETGAAEDVERAIKAAIWRKDFATARKLADSLKTDKNRARFAEEINVEEALSFIEKKNLFEAGILAAKLDRPNNSLRVYALLIKTAATNKNKEQARDFAYEAVKRLKKFDESTPAPYLISELTRSTASVDTALALDLLDEMVQSLNHRQVSSDRGEIGFDPQAFVELSPANEARVQQAARNIADRLQRIIALSFACDWRVKELTRSVKSGVDKSGVAESPNNSL